MQSSSQFNASVATPMINHYYQSSWAIALWTWTKAVVLSALVLLANYLLKWLRFEFESPRKETYRTPATVPYIFPILCSSIDFVWNPLRFIRSATFCNGRFVPRRVKIVGSDIYLIQGQENIASLFKQTAASTATYMHMFCLKNLFGMHRGPLAVYEADDSGDRPEPHAGSTTASHNRIDFLTHESLVKYFSGPSMSRLFDRFNRSLANRLTNLAIGTEWEEIPDFLDIIQMNLSEAVLEAMMGPQILVQNPTFVADLFKYDSAMPTLSKGLPRFMDPAAYAIRDKMLFMIKRWYTYAETHFDEKLVDLDGDFDPCWGSEHMRYRQQVLRNVDGFDADAIASSDLGLIWGTITNAIPCTFWALVHIYRDPTLLSQTRAEVRSSTLPPPSAPDQQNPTDPRPLETLFSTRTLLHQPLLQSIYAETLRLYVRGYITRSPAHTPLVINSYLFPQKSVLLASSDPAHFDPLVWNTRQGQHPLSTFWASRFLIRRGDPDSGPLRRASAESNDTVPQARPPAAAAADESAAVKFSLQGLSGAWIPYGGGSRACPGRAFAKREILTTCAMVLAGFDVEVLAGEAALGVQGGRYGLGAQKPVGRVRVRIRRARDPVC